MYIAIAAILIIYLGLSIYGAKRAMEIPRLPLNNSPSSVGLDYENVSFESRDNSVLLRGWYIPSSGNYVIVIVHGGFQNRVDEDVDTLALTKDLVFASQNKIGALVLDGCFIDVPTMVTRQAASFGIPKFLVKFFVPGLLFMTRIIYDYDMVNPIDVVDKVACPILFIHEELDESIKWEEANKLFRASGNPANEIWQISNTEHSHGYRTHPLEYIEKVDTFLVASSKAMSID